MMDGGKPVCKYGASCYRKNPDHLKRYSHPAKHQPGPSSKGDKDSTPPPKRQKLAGDVCDPLPTNPTASTSAGPSDVDTPSRYYTAHNMVEDGRNSSTLQSDGRAHVLLCPTLDLPVVIKMWTQRRQSKDSFSWSCHKTFFTSGTSAAP